MLNTAEVPPGPRPSRLIVINPGIGSQRVCRQRKPSLQIGRGLQDNLLLWPAPNADQSVARIGLSDVQRRRPALAVKAQQGGLQGTEIERKGIGERSTIRFVVNVPNLRRHSLGQAQLRKQETEVLRLIG